MGRLRYALLPAGLALGIAAEWSDHSDGLALTIADFIVGLALVALGTVAWARRPETAVGPILSAAGFAWFLGTIVSRAVYLHRGPLAQLLVSYPSGRLRSRLERAGVAAAYAYAAIYAVAQDDYATLGYAIALVAICLRRYAAAGGPERRARASALAAAVAFALVLVVGALLRLSGADAERQLLAAYDIVVLGVCAALFADLMWGRWTQAALTGLVVDLGDVAEAGSVRDKLARALGDPTLAIAFWLDDGQRYVDEAGRPFEFPRGDRKRAVTHIEENGRRVAAIVHDANVLNGAEVVSGVASATRLAVANVRLQTEIRGRVAEVEASRRRIVEAGDAQRERLEHELRDGAQQRLAHVAELLAACGPPLDQVRGALDEARIELGELARGLHPAALTQAGLARALGELAARSAIPVTVSAPDARLTASVDAALYFVCSEALANVAKHAHASRAAIVVSVRDGRASVSITDDGVGGAQLGAGTGLRGLADRVEALGGRLGVESPAGAGTRLTAEIPLG